MQDAVVVSLNLDVIADADAPDAPFGEDLGRRGQGFESRPVDLFKTLPARRRMLRAAVHGSVLIGGENGAP
jgi:hypothetical protein